MYSIIAIKERIRRYGLNTTLLFLTSPNLSPYAVEALTSSGILVNGYPNLSLISTL